MAPKPLHPLVLSRLSALRKAIRRAQPSRVETAYRSLQDRAKLYGSGDIVELALQQGRDFLRERAENQRRYAAKKRLRAIGEGRSPAEREDAAELRKFLGLAVLEPAS